MQEDRSRDRVGGRVDGQVVGLLCLWKSSSRHLEVRSKVTIAFAMSRLRHNTYACVDLADASGEFVLLSGQSMLQFLHTTLSVQTTIQYLLHIHRSGITSLDFPRVSNIMSFRGGVDGVERRPVSQLEKYRNPPKKLPSSTTSRFCLHMCKPSK